MTTPSLPASGHGEVAGLVEELRAGLEGVTPGPWYQTGAPWFRSGDGVLAGSPDGNVAFLIADLEAFAIPRDEYEGPFPLGDAEKDAAHIARCSPDNIAKLLDHIDALTAQIASPTPSPVEARADGVRVKALEWRTAKFGMAAYTRFGTYSASTYGYSFCGLTASAPTLEAAKAAAQADYEARILAALESTQPLKMLVDRDQLRTMIEQSPDDEESDAGVLHPEAPAQPVREGPEGKAEPVAWRISPPPDTYYGTGSDTLSFGELSEADIAAGYTQAPLYSLPQTQAAEIARLTRRIQSADAYIVEQQTRAERAESELAVIRGALEPFAKAANDYDTKYQADVDEIIRYPENLKVGFSLELLRRARAARAALANTADRGQEEKGNG